MGARPGRYLNAPQHPRQLLDTIGTTERRYRNPRDLAFGDLGHAQVLVCLRRHLWQVGDAQYFTGSTECAQLPPDDLGHRAANS
jgi:hypothetical protein